MSEFKFLSCVEASATLGLPSRVLEEIKFELRVAIITISRYI